MFNFTAPISQLQDGTFRNPMRCWKKRKRALVQELQKVKDGRDPKGIRHPLVVILVVLLFGISAGCKNIVECVELAKSQRKYLKKLVFLPYGIPHATTISRAIQVCESDTLVEALCGWSRIMFGELEVGEAASADGKTLRGVHGEDVIRHMFSLVRHGTNRLLAQVGVKQKENEISASPRLLEQAKMDIYGIVVTADALTTQTSIARDLRSKGADYIMMVKGNQAGLLETSELILKDPMIKKNQHRYTDYGHGREVEVLVELTNNCDLEDLGRDWKDIAWVGKVIRKGRRPHQTGKEKRMKPFYEETVFISSVQDLTAEKASEYIQGHWSIENGTHWQKDWSYLEDRQTLRKGNAPAVMSCLRSFWIGLLHEMGENKISETLRRFLYYPTEHRKFLRRAYIYV